MAGGKWISFDPTVHAGHIVTSIAIIFAAGGVYAALQYDIAQLKRDTSEHKRQIEQLQSYNSAQDERWQSKIETLTREQNQSIDKLRDDMNGWFMRLDGKLDGKQDKPR